MNKKLYKQIAKLGKKKYRESLKSFEPVILIPVKVKKQRKIYRGKRNNILITKSGKINQTNIDNFLKDIITKSTFAEVAKMTRLIKNLTDNPKKGRRITTDYIISKVTKNKIQIMLNNMGLSIEWVSDYTGISISDLANKANWNGTIYNDGTNSFEVTFGYEGENNIEIYAGCEKD